MQYHEAAGFVLDLRRFRSKPGTESTRSLLESLGDPQVGPTYVQIAGSNGKGSTARMVESICRAAGLDVGLYTSPHLQDLRERITVNGRQIPRSRVTEFVESIHDEITSRAAGGDAPTFFETVTALALWHFGHEDVDIAVLEVGIGGRLDATSVIEPAASAVTTVSLEHTELLGDTVTEIARDKATVAPATGPLITGTTGDALEAVRDVAPTVETVGDEAADITAHHNGHPNRVESAVSITGEEWTVETQVPLLGAVQARNAGIAAALARAVASVDEATITRGLRTANWPGRTEIVQTLPTVLLDGAHNPQACSALADAIDHIDRSSLYLVVGAMHDKDHPGMAAGLPAADTVITCRADIDRAADPTVLNRVFETAGYSVTQAEAVPDAVELALDKAGHDDLVVITGSLAVVGEARPRWTRTDVPRTVEDTGDATRVLRNANVDDQAVDRFQTRLPTRTIETRVRPRRATALAAEFRDIGGTAAVSAVARHDTEPVSLVLSGTVSQFDQLVDTVGNHGLGLEPLAITLRDRVDTEAGNPISREADVTYPWEQGTAVMGILNVTPDSFHDGGEFFDPQDAIDRAEAMVSAGADIIDIGGESTRPGAEPTSVAEERDRVIPVIEAISELNTTLSVDTRKASVARAALDAGADMINDVSGLADPSMRFLAAEYDVPIVIMHSIDTPVNPDNQPTYDDVVDAVRAELVEPVQQAVQAGVDRDKIIVDPGIGFGKTGPESFELLDRVGEFHSLGCPVLVGHSHKSLFETAGYGPEDREHPTVAATALAAERGADIVRVHDVPENVAAVRIAAATENGITQNE